MAISLATVGAAAPVWTERKLGRIIIKAEHAAQRRHWAKAIHYGEQILKGTVALDPPNDPRYINQLTVVNRYYDRAGRLKEVAGRVSDTYSLSRKYLGWDHKTPRLCRLLYYKLLLEQKNYAVAITLVQENIARLEDGKENRFRRLHYLEQLYALYGLTGQWGRQAQAIHRFLALHRKLLPSLGQDEIPVLTILAKSYCRQKQLDRFSALKTQYSLPLNCPA